MKVTKVLGSILSLLLLMGGSARGKLMISEFMANPLGDNDSPFEYVELIATDFIDFSLTPYSVVFANNGAGTSQGWIAGGNVTYGFYINYGSVSRGQVVYVGGSGMAPTGLKLRALPTDLLPGDGFGAPSLGGVLGNGGNHADGIAVFNGRINLLTPDSVPVDAVFFGERAGNAVVNGGLGGYQLPVNDLYNGGKLQSSSFLAVDAPAGQPTVAEGIYDHVAGIWIEKRKFSASSDLSYNFSEITVVPEPSSLVLWTALGGAAAFFTLRARRKAAR